MNAVVDIRDTLWLVHAVMLSNIPVVFIMYYREVTCYGWNPKSSFHLYAHLPALAGCQPTYLPTT